MGRLPKPVDKRQRRNNRGDVGLLATPDPGTVEVPTPSKQWSSTTIEEWNDYFESPLVQMVVSKADMSSLRRLFDYRDELRRSMRQFRKERMTSGASMQPRLSPMFDAVMRLERMITPLEDRFGMTPMARLKLGASFGDASRSLADINAELDVGSDDDDDDPRFDVIDGTSDEGTAGL